MSLAATTPGQWSDPAAIRLGPVLPTVDDLTENLSWRPRADIIELPLIGTIRIQVELPGVRLSDVRVELEGTTLLVKGQRQSLQSEKWLGETWSRVERRHGPFERSFQLPVGTLWQNITSRLSDGILTIEIRVPPENFSRGTGIREIAITKL